ncbi:MAG: ATP-binding protein [Clostridium sp.]
MTLKGKIMGIIVFALIIFNFGLTLFIYNTLYTNLKNNIKNDMDNIRKFTINTLKYSALVIEDDSKVKNKTISEVNSNYNCYIGIYDEQGINIDYKGSSLLNSSIVNILQDSNGKSSAIRFNNKQGLISTYVYPIYLSGVFDSTLIIQQDYSKDYNSIIGTMYNIITVQIILLIIIVIALNYFINKIIKPLKQLSEEMKKYGDGREVDNLKITSHDEVGQVTAAFNEMIKEKRKLENISREFFNNATHELKTPVTSIYGYVQILENEDLNKIDENFKKRAFNRISMECCKLRDLIQKLLEISRGGVRRSELKQEFQLDELIETICDRLIDRANRLNRKFIIELESIKLIAIKEDIEQIILNLIDNSLKYSKGNNINILLKKSADSFIFEIENEAGNIPENVLKNILDPFVKYNEFEGKMEDCISSSGLGLYLCDELAKKNNMFLKYAKKDNKIKFKLIGK